MSALQSLLRSAPRTFSSTLTTRASSNCLLTIPQTTIHRPSHSSIAESISSIRSFSTTNPVLGSKRAPRPKQRVVREQKFEAVKAATLKKSPGTTSKNPFAGKNPTQEQVIRSKTRQWKKVDERDSLSSRTGSSTGGGFGSKSSIGAGGPPRKRIQSTSISVTSLEKGSRNPQFEHSFAPGFASTYRGNSRNLPLKTGNAGRDKAAAAERTLMEAGAKRKSGPKVRGFVPVRFALKPIASDVNLNLVSTRKIPASKFKLYATGGAVNADGSTVAGNVAGGQLFAKPQESVKEMLDKVANSRFESMGLHPDVERGVLEILTKSTSIPKPPSSLSSSLSSMIDTTDKTLEVAAPDFSKIKPTEIQAMTIPASIDPHKKSPYTLCAAETGSGKTLAYLIPALHDLKTQEDQAVIAYKEEGGVDQEGSKVRALNTIRQFNQPRAIVLLPSRELVAQVSGILKELSHTVKLRTLTISHALSQKSVIQRLAQGPVDIVVATPASLLDYLPKSERESKRSGEDERKSRGSASSFEDNRISLDSLRHLVIDEADSMFDRGFGAEVTKIVQQAKAVTMSSSSSASKSPVKITVVSATLPKMISDTLDETLPGLLKITTPSLHKSLPGLHQTFLDLKPYFGNRPKAILDILAKQQLVSGSKRKENTLIFCNTKHSCELVYGHLKANNVPGVLGVLHGDATNRDEILQQFTDDSYVPPSPSPSSSSSAITSTKGMGGKILISTDIASRGIDTTAVQHVVLYDFPVTIVDYLHRVGRTARGGRGGRATSLVGRKDRNMAERIMVGIRLGKVLS